MYGMNATYGRSQGIRLLEAAAQELGLLFTRQALRPLAERQGLSDGHLSQLLSRLNASGQIAILKRGVYAVQSPLYAGEVHPFAIAAALLQPAAISHWSALAHHGFTTQLPEVVQATTTAAVITPEMRRGRALRPRQRAVWRVLDVEMRDGRGAGIAGGESARLVQYALRYGVGALIKRLGWSLERMGVDEQVLAPLRAYPVTAWYPLDPRGERRAARSPRWHIVENLAHG